MSHFIMQKIGKFSQHINVIQNNMERKMTFMICDLVFIDSLQCIASILFNLAGIYLKKASIVPSYLNDFSTDILVLIIKKESMLMITLMFWPLQREKRKVATNNKLYSTLTDENISDTDYV